MAYNPKDHLRQVWVRNATKADLLEAAKALGITQAELIERALAVYLERIVVASGSR